MLIPRMEPVRLRGLRGGKGMIIGSEWVAASDIMENTPSEGERMWLRARIASFFVRDAGVGDGVRLKGKELSGAVRGPESVNVLCTV